MFMRKFSTFLVSLKFLKKHEMLARGSLQFQNLTEVKGELCKTGKVVRKRHFYFLLLKADIYFCIHCYLFLVPSQLRITINNEKVILCFNYRNERCPERIVSIWKGSFEVVADYCICKMHNLCVRGKLRNFGTYHFYCRHWIFQLLQKVSVHALLTIYWFLQCSFFTPCVAWHLSNMITFSFDTLI